MNTSTNNAVGSPGASVAKGSCEHDCKRRQPPPHSLFSIMPSGRRYRSILAHSTRLANSLIHEAVKKLNCLPSLSHPFLSARTPPPLHCFFYSILCTIITHVFSLLHHSVLSQHIIPYMMMHMMLLVKF